jgi:hypothetical protein
MFRRHRFLNTQLAMLCGGLLAVTSSCAACAACGDDEPNCENGYRYSEKYKICYSPRCFEGALYDQTHNSCRLPCGVGFAYHVDRGVCYPCAPDAGVDERTHESICDPPEYDAG